MLSILGRILMLVACVPLLLPPCFCVCKVGDSGCTSPSPTKATGAVLPPSSHNAEACSHGHAPQDISSTETPGHQPPQKPAGPTHHDHSPGCPAASPAVERLQWSEPTPGVTVHLLPASYVVVELLAAVNSTRPPDRPGTHRPVSLPLYLSHCSLVI